MNLPSNNCRTKDFEIARIRLSKFVEQQAFYVTRVYGVNYEETEDAPSTYADLRTSFEKALANKSPYYVYKGACEDILFTAPHYNWAGRFWHDWLHYSHSLDFGYTDEVKVGELQCQAVIAEFGKDSLEHKLMHADTIGQTEYYRDHEAFVQDQLSFVRNYISFKHPEPYGAHINIGSIEDWEEAQQIERDELNSILEEL